MRTRARPRSRPRRSRVRSAERADGARAAAGSRPARTSRRAPRALRRRRRCGAGRRSRTRATASPSPRSRSRRAGRGTRRSRSSPAPSSAAAAPVSDGSRAPRGRIRRPEVSARSAAGGARPVEQRRADRLGVAGEKTGAPRASRRGRGRARRRRRARPPTPRAGAPGRVRRGRRRRRTDRESRESRARALAAPEPDRGRRDRTVHDSGRVRCGETVGELAGDVERLERRKGPAVAENAVERLAVLDELDRVAPFARPRHRLHGHTARRVPRVPGKMPIGTAPGTGRSAVPVQHDATVQAQRRVCQGVATGRRSESGSPPAGEAFGVFRDSRRARPCYEGPPPTEKTRRSTRCRTEHRSSA
jgi:hypothetical protein